MAQLVALPPTRSQAASAMKSLDAVLRYLPIFRFSLSNATKRLGLQGHADRFQRDMWLLVAHGYARQDHDSIYEITDAGRRYGVADESDTDDSPSIVTTPAPALERERERAQTPDSRC